jgi:hypothetical protein
MCWAEFWAIKKTSGHPVLETDRAKEKNGISAWGDPSFWYLNNIFYFSYKICYQSLTA